MHVKFRITFEDNSIMESHDEMWNIVADHAHALSVGKKWFKYALMCDDTGPKCLEVDFVTGIFTIDGIKIYPADIELGVLTYKAEPQDFPVSDEWKVNNGLPYFPIAGRRSFKGDLYGQPIDKTLFLCGWKKKFGDRVVERIAYIYPDGEIALQW